MNTRVLERGVAAGLIGATVVALVLFFVDLGAGDPFRTPGIMAGMLLDTPGAAGVPAYTILHYMSFLVIGITAAWALDLLQVRAPILIGLALGGMLFGFVFYGSAILNGPGIVDQVGWPAIFLANALAGLAMVFTVRRMSGDRSDLWIEEIWRDPWLREGVFIGLSAAAAVAVWVLAVDTIRRQPLFTPGALGSAFLLDAGNMSEIVISSGTVLGYTLIHGLAFMLIGVVIAGIVRAAESTPSLVIFGVLLFFVFEAFFVGVVALFAEFILGETAWWTILGGNLVAAFWIAGWIARRHPKLVEHMQRAQVSSEERT